MSKISKMSLRDVLENITLVMRENDIIYFCDDMNLVKEFIQRFGGKTNKPEEVKEFLLEHEENINKEKLILLVVKNCKDSLDALEISKKQLLEQYYNEKNTDLLTKMAEVQMQYKQQKEMCNAAIKIGKGIENFLTFYYYDEKEKRYRVEVVDSREIIDGKQVSGSKNLKRFDKIDEALKNDSQDELGLEFALQSILLTDLYNVFPTESFGIDLRTMILENQIIKEGIKTHNELEDMRNLKHVDKYTALLENVYFEGMLSDVKATLREYVRYIDLDKLLLISAFRFNDALENENINPEMRLGAKEILNTIIQNITDSKVGIFCELQRKKDNIYENEKIRYSTDDIRKCLTQFTSKGYLTKADIEGYREKIYNKEINLAQLNPEEIKIIFADEELETLSTLSVDNLLYLFTEYEWDLAKLIKLYEEDSISLTDLKQIQGYINLNEGISFEQLNSYYKYIKENPEDEAAKNKYEKYLNLYKEILLADKSQEELQEASNIVTEMLVEGFEGEEYNEAIKEYFKAGIINLNSIAEWSNDNIIREMYNEGLISLQDMQDLVKEEKIPYDTVSEIYSNLIKNENIEYDKRLELIKSGFVKKEYIFDLYKRNLLFEEDLRKLAEEQFIEESEMQRIINSRTMEELERNSAIRLTGLNSLTKKNNDSYYYGNSYNPEIERKATGKFIINPETREEFIRLLKAYKASTDLMEDSPFYNYEFYVIPDETGAIGLNSVVIAERYYEDKDTQMRFATDNATYFFKYKDLMVLSNLRKSEMTKERTNIVFTANHVLAKEQKEGRWAKGVITNLVRTMLSSDLKEYNRKNQRTIIEQKLKEIYTNLELAEILCMATEIDLGEYICEIEEAVYTPKRRSSSRRVTGDEGR